MKKTAIAAALLCMVASVHSPVFAAEAEHIDPRDVVAPGISDSDPCKVFLCMAGMVYGENPSECHGSVKKFFSINAFKKKHRFNPGKTFDMRKQFLGNCPSADRDHLNKIMNKFGRIRG